MSSVVCQVNADESDGLVQLAKSSGSASLNFIDLKPTGRGFENKDTLDLAPNEWRTFYEKAADLQRSTNDLKITVEDPIVASVGSTSSCASGNGIRDTMVKGSVCGKLSLAIKANGDITPCGFIPIIIGNLVEDDLLEVWNRSNTLDKLRNKNPTGKCLECRHYEECLGGCNARNLALTGDFNSPDPHCWQFEPA